MRLVLHVGTHKTGTTSIQFALAHNRDWLRAHGYNYPAIPHNSLAHRLALEPHEDDKLIAELAHRDCEALILSAEEIWAVTAKPTDWEEFSCPDYWERRRQCLERLKRLLSLLGRPTVYLCLRRHDEFATSLYATKILSARFRGSFAEFCSKVTPLLDYRRQVECFRAVFDDVKLKSFDELRKDLVTGFCNWTAIPPVSDRFSQRRRVTPDARLIAWLCLRTASEDRYGRALRTSFVMSEAAKVLHGQFTLWGSHHERREFLNTQCTEPEPGFFSFTNTSAAKIITDNDLEPVDTAFAGWRCGLDGRAAQRIFERFNQWASPLSD